MHACLSSPLWPNPTGANCLGCHPSGAARVQSHRKRQVWLRRLPDARAAHTTFASIVPCACHEHDLHHCVLKEQKIKNQKLNIYIYIHMHVCICVLIHDQMDFDCGS